MQNAASTALAGVSRRAFLQSGLTLSGSLVVGCSSRPLDGERAPGTELGVVPFVGEGEVALETPFNAGLDGRLYTDLSTLDTTRPVTANPSFYVRTRAPDLLPMPARWRLRVLGHLDGPSELFLDELDAAVAPRGVHLMECSGNARGASFGLLSSAGWSGVLLADVLGRLSMPASASGVVVSGFDEHSVPSANGHSTPGASWVFGFDDLERTGAFLATHMNDLPLAPDHGAPVRLVVPGWYGCTCIKWVDELRFVADDEPATSQMLEFASRTHQSGAPALARDYEPAEIDLAAMPVRVEKWLLAGVITYRIVGIEWGGRARAGALEIRIGEAPWEPVARRSASRSVDSWRLWEHEFRPSEPGVYPITLRVPDRSVRTRRLDADYYLREVFLDEV